jgi:Flp pilus assembly protein TadG
MTHRHNRRNQRGIALILNAIMLIFTVAVVGLATDVGVMYMIKGRLSAAVDAAALAGGRAISLSGSSNDPNCTSTDPLVQAKCSATDAAKAFFTANFPKGYLGSLGTPTVTPTFTPETDASGNYNGVLDIQVTGSVSVPTYFMHMFNVDSVTVGATGTATRRGLVMMLVLDKSSSMGSRNSNPASSCDNMVAAARNFIQQSFSPYDYIGLVSFDYTASLDYAPVTTWGDGTLDTAIKNITCGNNTNSTAALELAYRQIKKVNLPLARNTIVFFTDGSPNGLTAYFPLRTQVDTRWGPLDTNGPSAPSQSGTPPGTYASPTGYACDDTNLGGNYSGAPSAPQARGHFCQNMPAMCTGPASGTVFGTIAQQSSQNPYGGSTGGLFNPMTGDASIPAVGTAPGCNESGYLTRQMIAYIPDWDYFGNSTHGVVATDLTTASPNVAVAGPDGKTRDTRDTWIYQVNSSTAPDPSVNPSTKFLGDLWTKPAYTNIGSGSNFFRAGPYNGFLRPDQPNTIVAASMNTAMDEANTIRSDKKYNPVINTIYLTGNGADAIDREFLPIIANIRTIPPLPYEAANTPVYNNPAYQDKQEHGSYLVTTDSKQLTALFSQLASEVLRISH